MAHTNVSSCVLSIVGSFSSGLDVFKKLSDKRKRRRGHHRRRNGSKKCDERAEEEELRLSKSLRQGPEDIGREYARSVYAVGDGFAIGDALAQTSLAEILLKLNTGLVGIISSFLNRDHRNDMQLDTQALTQLSDRSRIYTCRALRQLFKRMMQSRALPAPGLPPRGYLEDAEPNKRTGSPKSKRKASTTSHTKVKGPMLARVVIENSSRPSQIAIVKPSERRKKSSSSSSSELSKASSTPSTPPPEYAPEPPPRPVAVRSNTAPAVPKPGRKQAVGNLPAHSMPQTEQRQAALSTSRLAAPFEPSYENNPYAVPLNTTMAPPLPTREATANLAAQSTPALAHRTRKATPTYYSIASDSTRLGEIPLHRWNVPYDFDRMELMNREAERKGWPGNDIGAGANEGVGKRGWGFRRLFGRK